MTEIHATAIVDPGASIGADVSIGPYCTVGADVVLGDGVKLVSHVVIDGRTKIGSGTIFYPFSSIGLAPQDLKYNGEPSQLIIGENNVVREHATMNPGTEGGGMITKVGDHNLFMVGTHVGHDCQVGNHVILANNATVAGHVEVGDWAILGGLAAVHQFVRIGSHAMIGGMTGVEKDVIPYGSATGNRAHLAGLNLIGMKRRGVARDDIHAVRNAYKDLFSDQGNLGERVDQIAQTYGHSKPVMEIVDFVRAQSSRSFCQPQADDRG